MIDDIKILPMNESHLKDLVLLEIINEKTFLYRHPSHVNQDGIVCIIAILFTIFFEFSNLAI
jgi:hypothetical protein